MKGPFIAPDAVVTGNVVLEEKVNIWHGAVLRGDSGTITVGEGTNIQDRCVLHEETTVGSYCTFGHGAIIHGCRIGDECLIGMGAIILDGAVIGDQCIVGAGALVTGKMNAPAGSMILGSPGKIVRELTGQQRSELRANAEHYIELAEKTF